MPTHFSGPVYSTKGFLGPSYPGDYKGRVYFVDNVNGASGNDGLTWATAFAQISQAITAAEAYRLALANPYVRNQIMVAGTATAYTNLTALPNYCDIIGVGADPRGNGSGIARVSAITGTDTMVDATGARGLYVYNMQFTGAGTGYAWNSAILFRSIFENCAFVNKSTAAMIIVTGGGITIRNCMFGGDTVTPAIGLEVGTAAGNFNQSLVENNVIYGSTTGFYNHAYLQDGTVLRNNTIYGGTTGLLDDSTQTGLAGLAFYVGNFISGADAMNVTNSPAARVFGNSVVNTVTGAKETSGS